MKAFCYHVACALGEPCRVVEKPWSERRVLLVDAIGFERITHGHRGAHDIMWAAGRKMVRFELYGETIRDGEPLLEYREEDRREVTPPTRVEVPPTVERLARSLFETDERVQAFVRIRSEAGGRDHDETKAQIRAFLDVGAREPNGPARWDRAVQIAWERDENGWRTEAEVHAKAVLRAMTSEIRSVAKEE